MPGALLFSLLIANNTSFWVIVSLVWKENCFKLDLSVLLLKRSSADSASASEAFLSRLSLVLQICLMYDLFTLDQPTWLMHFFLFSSSTSQIWKNVIHQGCFYMFRLHVQQHGKSRERQRQTKTQHHTMHALVLQNWIQIFANPIFMIHNLFKFFIQLIHMEFNSNYSY